ncbi:metalloprotease PmbA, partial [Buchnera aphidicola]|nr:metalloprotease PmbA [Buchnera aphidicola]
LSIENIVKLVQISESSAFQYDNKIVNSEGSFFNTYSNIIVFGNSLGMLENYKSTQFSISTCVIAKDKNLMERDFDYSISRKFDDLNDVKNIGENSARRAISRLGSRKIKTMITPV